MLKENIKLKFALIFLIMFMVVLPMVNAVPPITSEFIGDVGYDIEVNVMDYYKINTGACVQIFVFNKTDGSIATADTVSCVIKLSDPNGTEILTGSATGHENHFDMCRNSSAVTTSGIYGLTIVCNDSNSGGYKTHFAEFNLYGAGLTDATEGSHNNSMWLLMILFGLSIVGIFAITSPIGKLTSYFSAHILFIIGCFSEWQFLQGYAINVIANAGIFKVLFYVSLISLLPAIILAIAGMIVYFSTGKEITRLMNKGMSEAEAYHRQGGKFK